MRERYKKMWNMDEVLSYETFKSMHESEIRSYIESSITEKMMKIITPDEKDSKAETRGYYINVKYNLIGLRYDTMGVIAATLSFSRSKGAKLESYIKW